MAPQGMGFPGKGRRAEVLEGARLAGSGARRNGGIRLEKEGQILENPGCDGQGLGFYSE